MKKSNTHSKGHSMNIVVIDKEYQSYWDISSDLHFTSLTKYKTGELFYESSHKYSLLVNDGMVWVTTSADHSAHIPIIQTRRTVNANALSRVNDKWTIIKVGETKPLMFHGKTVAVVTRRK